MSGKYHYLDHNATTPAHPRAARAMAELLLSAPGSGPGTFGNPSSLHAAGREARRLVEDAREAVAALVGADPSEIVFTSGGTEANNLALLGVCAASLAADAKSGRAPRRHLVVSSIEHSSVLEPARALEAEGWAVSWIDPDGEGVVRPEPVARALRPDTVLVSVMAANNETGAVQPVSAIASLLAGRGPVLHTDAVQALGKLERAHPGAWGADLAAFSAHKIGGPKGVGALYVRKGTALRRLLHGGPHERRLRGGTENVPGIVGFGEAAEAWLDEGPAERARLAGLRDALAALLRERLPDLVVNAEGAERVPNTLHVTVPGCPSDLLVMGLDLRGVAASSGSACASGAAKASHVVLAMGKGREAASSSLRLSLGRGNEAAHLPDIADRIADAARAARAAG